MFSLCMRPAIFMPMAPADLAEVLIRRSFKTEISIKKEYLL